MHAALKEPGEDRWRDLDDLVSETFDSFEEAPKTSEPEASAPVPEPVDTDALNEQAIISLLGQVADPRALLVRLIEGMPPPAEQPEGDAQQAKTVEDGDA